MFFLATATGALAQEGAADAQDHLRQAFEAYGENDYDSFTSSLETAAGLNPFSLATRYYLARGYALSERPEQALDVLEKLAAMKVDFGYAQHRDFESLREHPRFIELIERLDADTQPIINSTHRYTMDQLGIIPEGIALDPATDRLFISSMRNGDIFVIDESDGLSKFANVHASGTMAAIGLFVDTPRNLLWAVGATFELTEGYDAGAVAETGVFGYDLESAELKKQYLAGDPEAFFNDVSVSVDGTIYLSGSDVSVVASDEEQIRVLPVSPGIYGSNGITSAPDGRHLFVSSYPVGIYVIDIETGTSRLLGLPDDTTLYGVDGMYWYEGDLVGVQSGVEPWRLVRISMDDEFTAVTGVRVLELANPDIEPTTGAIDGNRIHLVGQGPAPDIAPAQFPQDLRPFLGKTVVITVPL